MTIKFSTHAQKLGAYHLRDVEFSEAGWKVAHPGMAAYHDDGTVHFLRSDNGIWDIVDARVIAANPAMMQNLPHGEQARIIAHARWYGEVVLTRQKDSKGRQTRAAYNAKRRLGRVSKKMAAELSKPEEKPTGNPAYIMTPAQTQGWESDDARERDRDRWVIRAQAKKLGARVEIFSADGVLMESIAA